MYKSTFAWHAIPFQHPVLNARLTPNACSTLHASSRGAKTLAPDTGAASMPSARSTATGPTVSASADTREIQRPCVKNVRISMFALTW